MLFRIQSIDESATSRFKGPSIGQGDLFGRPHGLLQGANPEFAFRDTAKFAVQAHTQVSARGFKRFVGAFLFGESLPDGGLNGVVLGFIGSSISCADSILGQSLAVNPRVFGLLHKSRSLKPGFGSSS